MKVSGQPFGYKFPLSPGKLAPGERFTRILTVPEAKRGDPLLAAYSGIDERHAGVVQVAANCYQDGAVTVLIHSLAPTNINLPDGDLNLVGFTLAAEPEAAEDDGTDGGRLLKQGGDATGGESPSGAPAPSGENAPAS